MTFDPLAPTYDTDFTHTATGRYLRGRVQARLIRHFRAGNQVLELGCGTGEDALFLAHNGIHVLATDASTEMLETAHAKTGNHPRIAFAHWNLRNLPQHDQTFDGAFANFGVLNCLDDWRPLAAWLAERIKPGGMVGFGIMSPFCIWEIAWHSLHGDAQTAFRRLRKNTSFKTQDMIELIAYPTIKRMTHDFMPCFTRIYVEPLGLTLPPSDVFGVVEKYPTLLRLLTTIDEYTARFSRLAQFADHYWIEFIRRDLCD